MTVYSFSKPLPLDPDIPQDALDRFDCDVPVLNQWLRTRSVHNEKYGNSRTYVAFDEGGEALQGIFALAMLFLIMIACQRVFVGISQTRCRAVCLED